MIRLATMDIPVKKTLALALALTALPFVVAEWQWDLCQHRKRSSLELKDLGYVQPRLLRLKESCQ